MTRILLISLFISVIFTAGCGKEKGREVTQSTNKTGEQEQVSDTDTTEMTPAEIFAEALVQNVMNDEDEPELEDYIAGALYAKLSASQKVTIDRISSSLFIIKYFENGTEKNLLLQKYYNPKEDEIYFESSETQFSNTKLFLK
ncbi:MAG: hypothetical protein LWX07_03245 [Bacteroidetes bacterium]|nr:hypothetical protein [Bacteroidota bacterium]